ncbi:MAG TPA: MipA/OmpV family protein [Gammaproteobacteria bacterium]|nr:MipA/OmpV family protein [Gammaproteobacteria bacterium]
MSSYRRAAALILFGLSAPLTARADAPGQAPPTSTLELGIGVGSVRYPDYPGAIETRSLTLPFPYVVFRNPHLRVNNNRVRGIVLARSNWSLDLDFSGQPYVESDRTRERLGMPDLDWLGQVGPALRYLAWEDAAGATELDAVVPLRAAVGAQGLTLHHRGWVFAPRLELDHDLPDGPDHLDWDVNLTAVLDDRSYNQYYYGVAPEFATASRPEYAAAGGFAGYRAEFGFSLHRGDLIYGAFVNYTSLHGAVFLASPLVGRSDGLSFGLSLSWILQRSD